MPPIECEATHKFHYKQVFYFIYEKSASKFSVKSTEFAERIDTIDESELTNAELAYYIEVTSRVSQRLLQFAG